MKKCYCGLFIIFSVLLSSCNSIMDTTTHATVTTEAPIVSTTTITEEMTLTTETEITQSNQYFLCNSSLHHQYYQNQRCFS